MTIVFLEISLILVLLLANGVFAMTEIAIVSSRRAVLQAMADRGSRGAARALALAENPNRFLSTVQIGITLVGIVAGAFGGASLAERLAVVLAPVPGVGAFANELSFVVVIGALTYFSLVIGELVPKRLALRFPESIAITMSGPMAWLSRAAAPFVALLSGSTSALLRLCRVKESAESRMSREEFTVVLREGLIAGSTDRRESRMIQRVFDFGNLDAYDLMIPRPKMLWIERDARHEDVWPLIIRSTQEVFPIYHERRDNLVGVVSVKDLYAHLATGIDVSFRHLMQDPVCVPETQKADVLLETFRSSGQRAVFVLDEFGGVSGMVTLIDLMESIVGDVPSREERLVVPIRERDDGSWVIDGMFEVRRLGRHLDGFVPNDEMGAEYQTLAGWFSHHLARVPVEGDHIAHDGWTFEILDMDGVRVDKIIATRKKDPAEHEIG